MLKRNGRAGTGLAWTAGVLASMAAVGCQSAGLRLNGRVIEGPIGVVAAVESKDERLKEPGVGGVKIDLRASNSLGSRTMAEGTSAPDGSFSLPLAKGQSLSDQLRLTAKREGFVATQGVTFIPGAGRELLVVLKRSDGQSPTPGPQDGQTRPHSSSR